MPARKISSVVRVGGGRGFVIEIPRRNLLFKMPERVIVTAAHCLPELPPAHRAAYLEERTYFKLVGPLGKKPTIAAECYFVDPVADVAVLGSPDDQELSEDADAFDELVEAATPLPIADLRPGCNVRLMALSGRWFECALDHRAQAISLVLNSAKIEAGMSGSPIIQDASAVGIVTLSGESQARLMRDLPARMLRHDAR